MRYYERANLHVAGGFFSLCSVREHTHVELKEETLSQKHSLQAEEHHLQKQEHVYLIFYIIPNTGSPQPGGLKMCKSETAE